MQSDNDQLLDSIRQELKGVPLNKDFVDKVAESLPNSSKISEWLETPGSIPDGDLPEVLGAIATAKQDLGIQ